MANTIFTVGHSVHPIEEFLGLLSKHNITAIADVRSSPYSRYNPQFNLDSLKARLSKFGIAYAFLGKELGARSEDPDCYVNGKAQYERLANTDLFQTGLTRVIEGLGKHRVALMCAEKDPITCHRTILVCRHLISHGIAVKHILEDGRLEEHDKSLSRLFLELGIAEHDLFRSREDLLSEAYYKRGQDIAYSVKDSPVNEWTDRVQQ